MSPPLPGAEPLDAAARRSWRAALLLVLLGTVLQVVDVGTPDLDVLPDPVGAALVGVGLLVAPGAPRAARVPRLAGAALALACVVLRGDPRSVAEGLQLVALALAAAPLAVALGDARRARRLSVLAGVQGLVAALGVSAGLVADDQGQTVLQADGATAALLLVAVLALLAAALWLLLLLQALRRDLAP